MTSKDRWMIIGVIAVAMLGAFIMFVLKPANKAASDAQAQVQTAQTALANAQAKVTSGKAAQAAFRRDRATIVKIGRVVPESDDIPTLITQLETLAHRYNVYFIKYSIAQGGGGTSSASSSSSTSTTPGSTAAASSSTAQPGAKGQNSSTNAVAPLYPPGSVEMTGGLGRTPITIGLRGTYFGLERYLRAVQRFAVLSAKREQTNGRLIIVDGFTYKGGMLVFSSDKNLKVKNTQRWLDAELGASVYFAPPLETPSASSAAAPAAGATPAASTASPSTSTGAATIGGLR